MRIRTYKRFHVKKGDEVVVLSGTEKGKRGKVIEVLSRKERAIVEGLKMIKRHTRKNQANPQGAIVEREGTIHLSNLMRVENHEKRLARRGGGAETGNA